MPITVSSPGKIHLLGEHAVVYGRPSLLAAIDKRLYVKVQSEKRKAKSDKEIIRIDTADEKELVWEAIEVFKKGFSIDRLPPLKITITSQIPTGSGLGSSAALSAAVIGALMKFVKNIWNPNKINELSFEVEKAAHGNPSGADNTTVVFGGLVWFRREFDFLKSIWSLPIKNYKIPKLALIDSGMPLESTKDMVSQVERLYSQKRGEVEEVFNDQEKQTKMLLLALKEGNNEKFAFSLKQGERNLEKISVVGSFAKEIIRKIESIGGAAKICGAGGRKRGSGIILVFHQHLSKIEVIGKKYNLPVVPVKLGGEGIHIENNPITQSDQ